MITGIEVDAAKRHLRVLDAYADAISAAAPDYILAILREQRRSTRKEFISTSYRPHYLGPVRHNAIEVAAETLFEVAFPEYG